MISLFIMTFILMICSYLFLALLEIIINHKNK